MGLSAINLVCNQLHLRECWFLSMIVSSIDVRSHLLASNLSTKRDAAWQVVVAWRYSRWKSGIPDLPMFMGWLWLWVLSIEKDCIIYQFVSAINSVCNQVHLSESYPYVNDRIIDNGRTFYLGCQPIDKMWRFVTGGSLAILTLKIRNPWFADYRLCSICNSYNLVFKLGVSAINLVWSQPHLRVSWLISINMISFDNLWMRYVDYQPIN